jgi:peptidoglycan/LPS O-acetylase OafA/YrhL
VWPLDALAAISFPLYAIHALMGYSLLKLFMLEGGLDYLPSLAITIALVILAATALHVTVERWSIAAGRRLAPHPIADAGPIAKAAPALAVAAQQTRPS